jgi:hypothetical protein
MLKWYVLYTKLHGERQVASHLEQHGYHIFPRFRSLARGAIDPANVPISPVTSFSITI